MGQYVSYSAFVDLDRADLFKISARRRAADPAPGRAGRVRRIRYLSGVRDPRRRRGSSLLRRMDALRVGALQRRHRMRDQSRSGRNPFASSDGGPVLGYSPDEPFVLSGPKIRRFDDRWYLWYIAGRKWKWCDGRPEPVYKIRMAMSDDGIHWTRVNRDLIESRLEVDEAQASPDVFYADGKYHMFFCYRRSSDFRGRDNGYRIGYASSPNLVDWTRDDAKAGIDVPDEGWDAEMISYPHVFELDGKTYMAYLGNQVGRYGFGLAIARRTGGVTVRHEVEEGGQDLRSVAARAAERLRRSLRSRRRRWPCRRLRPDLLLDPCARRAQRQVPQSCRVRRFLERHAQHRARRGSYRHPARRSRLLRRARHLSDERLAPRRRGLRLHLRLEPAHLGFGRNRDGPRHQPRRRV